ncbi:hypothetical protein FVER53590_10933 [Fusarium verticillioides]|nr:hypothetical protein FVER53590_10933 [Fusarium verticillioides]
MPALPRPSRGRPRAFSKQDEDLWKAYTKALQTKIFSNLDSKNEIFYAAPVGMMGIPAGANISQVLGAVKLGQNRDLGAEKRMNDIHAKVTRLNTEYAELSKRAMESYAADEDKDNIPFGKWVPVNLAGPGAAQLNMQRQRLFSTCELDKMNAGLNMPCAPSFGNIVNGSSDIPQKNIGYSRPTYTIENSYRDIVGSWIKNAGGENKFNLTFNINDAKSAPLPGR